MVRILAMLVSCAAVAAAEQEPRILSCVAGLMGCMGVPGLDEARAWGCAVVNVTNCDGSVTPKTGATPQQIGAACIGQNLKNTTSQDGTPVTFSWPVDVTTVKPEYFEWTFLDGTKRSPGCAIRNANPAGEKNELQTIAIIGDAGGWGSPMVAMEIVGDIILVAPNGTRVSAKGLRHTGESLKREIGLLLLTAKFEPFSTDGETLKNPIIGARSFPNHCQHLFPSTTHRLQLLFDGGVSLDGMRQITPDRTDLLRVLDAAGAPLPAAAVLGLADLGSTVPQTQCDKDNYVADGDNYLDVCLKIDSSTPVPAAVHLNCDMGTQISLPKGTRYPCKPQTVNVTQV